MGGRLLLGCAEGLRRVPLRVHLVMVLLLLMGGALVGTMLGASVVLDRYLTGQLDDQLTRTAWALGRSYPGIAGARSAQPGSYLVEIRGENGTQVRELEPGQATSGRHPALPADLPSSRPITVPSADGGIRWRVLAVDVPGDQHIVVAASQQEVDLAVRDMRRIFLLLSLGALGVTGVLVYRLVGRSLRPLEEVERTAAVIATGDLSLRVPVRRPGSEVGRLAAAFNSMLGQIESAFLARADSEQAARRSEERMRRFVADASHELRTPLTSIRGYAELYRQGSVTDPEEVSRLLRRVEDEGARMGLLVDDLLLLARLDRQRPPTNDLVDLVVLAGDAVHDARAVDPGRPVGLRVDLPAGLEDGFALPVLGDEARLRQVLGNLVGNALTHTPPGTPVEVRLRAEGGDAVVEVADSGPGLPPEHAEHVFERFFRVDAGRSRAAGGTGLGLAIVAALVEAHGGRVEVRTAPGEGATFRVLLPRHADGGQVQRPDDGPA